MKRLSLSVFLIFFSLSSNVCAQSKTNEIERKNDHAVLIDQSEILRDSYKKVGLDVEMLTKMGAGHGWKGTSQQERELVLGILKRCLASERE